MGRTRAFKKHCDGKERASEESNSIEKAT